MQIPFSIGALKPELYVEYTEGVVVGKWKFPGRFLHWNLRSTDLLDVHSLGLSTEGIAAHRGAAVQTGSGLQGASRHLYWADRKKVSDMLYRWFSLIFLEWSSKEIVNIKRLYGEDLNMLVFYNRRKGVFQVVFMMKTNFWDTQTWLLNGMTEPTWHLFWFYLWNNQICQYFCCITALKADKSGWHWLI